MFANIINPDPIGTVLRDDNGYKRVHIPYIGDLILSGGDLILSFIPYFLLNKKQKEGWEFMFIGANIDAAATAETIGIGRNMAANYCADERGTGVVFEALAAPLAACRASKKVDANWSAEIEADLKNRK